ncbi:MAG: alpha-L-rhamnosidase C-terminal domain-containing protein, partial [Oliverpabstia sp.]
RWERKGQKIVYECVVPVNTRAHIILPDHTERYVGSGQYHFEVY